MERIGVKEVQCATNNKEIRKVSGPSEVVLETLKAVGKLFEVCDSHTQRHYV